MILLCILGTFKNPNQVWANVQRYEFLGDLQRYIPKMCKGGGCECTRMWPNTNQEIWFCQIGLGD